MSKEQDIEIKVLKSLCHEMQKMVRDSFSAQDKYKSVIDELVLMLDSYQSMLHAYSKKSEQLGSVMNDAIENGKLRYNALAQSSANRQQKSLKGVQAASAKKKELRETTESFSAEYDRVVKMHTESGQQKHAGEQRAREQVADLVEAKIGKRPSRSLLYEVFPKTKSP